MLTLHLLARDGAYDRACAGIGELIQLLDRLEPNNHLLFCNVSLAYARMVSAHWVGGEELPGGGACFGVWISRAVLIEFLIYVCYSSVVFVF